MLAMADGCGLDVRCARGASSRGGLVEGAHGGDGWWWTLEDGRWSGPGSAVVVVCHPCHGAENKEGARPMPHGFVHVVQPLSPLITSSVRLSQRRARAGQGEALAGRWAATHLAEAGQSETEAGRRLRFSRPAHHEKGTKGTGRRAGPGPSPSPSPGRGGRGGVLTWKEGKPDGRTLSVKGEGGSVPCIPSRPRWR